MLSSLSGLTGFPTKTSAAPSMLFCKPISPVSIIVNVLGDEFFIKVFYLEIALHFLFEVYFRWS